MPLKRGEKGITCCVRPKGSLYINLNDAGVSMGASSPLQVVAVGDLRAINAKQDWPHPSAKLHHAEGPVYMPPQSDMCTASAPVMDMQKGVGMMVSTQQG